MKICEICENKFKVDNRGSGGKNRKLCFNCLPSGLDKKQRSEVRRIALTKKAQTEKLDLGCSFCGYNKCVVALEWHHQNEDKEILPSVAINYSWERYKRETEKCILLCANCHREKHNKI